MNYTGWIIYNKKDADLNSGFIDWFMDECLKQHLELTLVYREQLAIGVFKGKLGMTLNGTDTELPDFAIIRTVEPILNRQFEMMDIPVFNSAFISYLCNNKAITHQYMAALNIPMVHTVFLQKDHLQDDLPLQPPFVMKAVDGRGGQQVFMIKNLQDWNEQKQCLASKDLIIQSSEVQSGKDLRVFVVGKEIIGAVLRENNFDFRANFKLGGTASWYPLSEAETSLVTSIVDSFQFGMVGIDFLFDEKGMLLFNEIEDVVGSRTLSTVSSINILEKYAAYIKNTF